MKLIIMVTKEILKRSAMCGLCPGSEPGLIGHNCAIALAVRDIFPGAYVQPQCILPFGGNPYLGAPKISLPSEAISFISRFDGYTYEGRLRMHEISFEIEVPDSVIERIDISELTPLLENHPNLKLQTV